MLTELDNQLLEVEDKIKNIKNQVKYIKDRNDPQYNKLLIECLELQSKLLKQKEEISEMLLI